jgi:antitoxin (DNA-binding transcriptional repressor) of toxin-antitoxin stability system
MTVSTTEAKNKLTELLRQVENGEGETVEFNGVVLNVRDLFAI